MERGIDKTVETPKYDILRETWIYQEIKQEVTDHVRMQTYIILKIRAPPLLKSFVKSAARIDPSSLTQSDSANCKRARTTCGGVREQAGRRLRHRAAGSYQRAAHGNRV